MRKNEIASLRWEDVDGECIRLRAENAKNGTARLIPFEGELGELMERRKAARQVEANGTVILSALIFHCEGEPILGTFVSHGLRLAGRLASIGCSMICGEALCGI